MLKQRILTAFILIPLTLTILFYLPPTAFCLLTGLVALGAGWEWASLSGIETSGGRFFYLGLLLFSFVLLLFIPLPLILAASVLWWLLATVLVLAYPRGSGCLAQGRVMRSAMGVFTLSFCWVSINYLRNIDRGIFLLLYLFILVWGADITAYFVGKKWGTTKLAVLLSPGKSWQGFLGAMLFTVIVSAAILFYDDPAMNFWPWVMGWSLLTVTFSVIGDLFESMMKRLSNVKDSGHLLPGHGGLLDRIDSLTAAAPIFAFGVFLLWVFTAN